MTSPRATGRYASPARDRADPRGIDQAGGGRPATHHERLAQSTDLPTETSPGRRRNAKARTHKTRRYTGG